MSVPGDLDEQFTKLKETPSGNTSKTIIKPDGFGHMCVDGARPKIDNTLLNHVISKSPSL
jgi:hypothetical protein